MHLVPILRQNFNKIFGIRKLESLGSDVALAK